MVMMYPKPLAQPTIKSTDMVVRIVSSRILGRSFRLVHCGGNAVAEPREYARRLRRATIPWGQWEMSFLRRSGTAVGATAVYAATDEIHQLFVAGRSGRFSDVCIDSAGALAGVLVFALLVRIVKRVRARRLKRELHAQLDQEA